MFGRTMMISYILPIILKGFNSPSNDLLSSIVLDCDCQNLFDARFNIRETLLRRNLNIQSNKLNFRYVKLDLILRIFLRYVLVNIPIMPVDLKVLDIFVLLIELTTISYRSWICLLYTSPSPRDRQKSRMPSSA